MQPTHPIHSDPVKRGFEHARHRSLRKATGAIRGDGGFDKPFIGVCSRYAELTPRHVHLHEFSPSAGAADEAGGVPFALYATDGGILLENSLNRS